LKERDQADNNPGDLIFDALPVVTILDYLTNQTLEGQLLERYGQGDETAFRELVDKYKSGLRTFLRRFLNRPDLVEDVFQETLIQLYTSRDSYDVSRPLRPWLWTIAANKARDALRRAKCRPATPLSELVGSDNLSSEEILSIFAFRDDDPSVRLDRTETAVLIRHVVTRLPKNHCKILTLAYFDQLTYKQMAETLSIPIGTVKSRLHAAVAGFAREWVDFRESETAFRPAQDTIPRGLGCRREEVMS
jgi:RNA polymerase sigma-70 factor (ECF subfamily)